jgi:hypothetical protein
MLALWAGRCVLRCVLWCVLLAPGRGSSEPRAGSAGCDAAGGYQAHRPRLPQRDSCAGAEPPQCAAQAAGEGPQMRLQRCSGEQVSLGCRCGHCPSWATGAALQGRRRQGTAGLVAGCLLVQRERAGAVGMGRRRQGAAVLVAGCGVRLVGIGVPLLSQPGNSLLHHEAPAGCAGTAHAHHSRARAALQPWACKLCAALPAPGPSRPIRHGQSIGVPLASWPTCRLAVPQPPRPRHACA